MQLRRFAEAERILLEAQQACDDQNDIERLWHVLTTRATLEAARGHPQQALELQRTAIRLAYVQSDPGDVAISHSNLAGYLRTTEAEPAAARAHLLAAVLLFQLTGMTHELSATSHVLARELHRDANDEDLPGTLDEVVGVAQQTEGVQLDRLLTGLQPDRQAVADALDEILRTAADSDAEQDTAFQDPLRQWEPIIAAAAAAAREPEAARQFTPFLDQLEQDQDWAVLAAVPRHIIDGDLDPSPLEGLNPVHAQIAYGVLWHLAQPADTTVQEDP